MSIRSMTGFGQAESPTPAGTYRVEIRGVNNRFLEVQIRQPRTFSNLETKIKQLVSSSVARGSLTVFISCDRDDQDGRLVWDRPSVDNYMRIFREITETYDVKKNIGLSDLLHFSDFIKAETVQVSEKTLWRRLKPVLDRALVDFQRSREREARYIVSDLKKQLRSIGSAVRKIEHRAPRRIKRHRENLRNRIRNLNDNVADPQRLAQEVAIMADKMDISEECTRLNAHIEKFGEFFDSREPIGKRMSFLLQEMNREANTVGSKANDTEISHLTVELKESIEKIREQVQNIE